MNIEEAIALKVAQVDLNSKAINKFQLLCKFPPTEQNELSNISIKLPEYILQETLQDIMKLRDKLALLKAKDEEEEKEEQKSGKIEKEKEKEKESKKDDSVKKIGEKEWEPRSSSSNIGRLLKPKASLQRKQSGSDAVMENQHTDMFKFFLRRVQYPHLSIFPHVLSWKFVKLQQNSVVASISGPEDTTAEQSYGEFASAGVISTYPHYPSRAYREGDPICDRFHLLLYPNRAIVIVTDGCNWGEKPRKAARIANKSISQYLMNSIDLIDSTQKAVYSLIGAFAEAQNNVCASFSKSSFAKGYTTAIAGLMIEIDKEWVENNTELIPDISLPIPLAEHCAPVVPTSWLLIFANVGDCKAVIYNRRTGTVKDICTSYMRLTVTDPGGRLGPHYKEDYPDLRNFLVCWHAAEEGDIVMTMSDGVYDNLYPHTQGLIPTDFGIEADSWDSLEPALENFIKEQYFICFLEHYLNTTHDLTPKAIKAHLLDFCDINTEMARKFMAENPTSRAPKDLPGKLDHTTIVCFRVGRYRQISPYSGESVELPPPHCVRNADFLYKDGKSVRDGANISAVDAVKQKMKLQFSNFKKKDCEPPNAKSRTTKKKKKGEK